MNTESQTDRITQLEAACAAYRKLIVESIYDINGHLIEWPSQAEWFRVISSTDAGKSLLDRLQSVEKERDEWRKTAGERLDLLTKSEGRALELLSERDRYREALEKLSQLGGGRSEGNFIAQEALK